MSWEIDYSILDGILPLKGNAITVTYTNRPYDGGVDKEESLANCPKDCYNPYTVWRKTVGGINMESKAKLGRTATNTKAVQQYVDKIAHVPAVKQILVAEAEEGALSGL